jgi:hypothetical protein
MRDYETSSSFSFISDYKGTGLDIAEKVLDPWGDDE